VDQKTPVNIGISESDRKKVAHGVSELLADSYTLYLKTHNYHWNVTGPMFNTLHLMFEGQYTELATAVDLIAERIRALGYKAPGSYKEFQKLSTVSEGDGATAAKDMIVDLVHSHEAVVRKAREVIELGEEAGDQASVDLATQRLQLHEKTAWMLRSLVMEGPTPIA
jgi:starvation-inducible DNA-binding protein